MNEKSKNSTGSPHPVAEIVLRCRPSAPPRSLPDGEIPRLLKLINTGDDGAFRKLFNSLLPMICAKITDRYHDGKNILHRLAGLENCLRHHLLLSGVLDQINEAALEDYLERVVDRCLAE